MDEFQNTQLVNSRLPRRTYLVTYSQADIRKFPTRKGFGKCIKKHFNSGSGKVKVQHWACAKEKHQNGGIHYHVALKLIDLRRWRSVKRNHIIEGRNSGQFFRQSRHYYSAYKYICKDDDSVHHSKYHFNLDENASPRTKISTQAYQQARKPYAQGNPTDAPQEKEAESNIQATSDSIRSQ